MKQGRLGYNSSNGRYGLLSSDLWIDTGFHCGEGLEVLVGDESGKRMVSGGDTLLWRFGICAGKDIEINSPRQGARGLLMDGTAVESAFALLLTKVTKEGLVPDTSRTTNVREGSKILYPAKISYNRHNWRKYKLCAISGKLFR